jgi:hypothetical protein
VARPSQSARSERATGAPFLVVHRGGNRLEPRPARDGTRLAEADVRLYRGRLEIRHLKTLGPIPLYWDRRELRARWRPRLLLEDLLAATSGEQLFLDLKGRNPKLGELVAGAIRADATPERFTVCARSWDLLDGFAGLPVRRAHSVGTHRQLARLLEHGRVECVSIHERLLDATVMPQLRRVAATVLSWPVNDTRRAAELLALGVTGLITDAPDVIAPLVAAGAGA